MPKITQTIIAVIFCFMCSHMALAQQIKQLNPSETALLQKIDTHLNSQETMRSRFVQLDGMGGFVEGTLSWQRPDQARFDYDPPSPLLLVVTGNFLIEVDRELEQVSHYPQGGTIADYLLAYDMLQNPALAIHDFRQEAGQIKISVFEKAAPENGVIKLVFNSHSLNLQNWTILSPDGDQTIFRLIAPQFNLILDGEQFHFHAPKEWLNHNNN